jgi:hypothetical protein
MLPVVLPAWFPTAISTLVRAYETGWGPFDNPEYLLPETRALDHLDLTLDVDPVSGVPEQYRGSERHEQAARFVTFGSTLDYQRSAERHWGTMIQLYEKTPWLYDPAAVARRGREAVFNELQPAGVRFPNNDTDGWVRVAETLSMEYDASPLTLYDAHDHDAGRLLTRLREGKGFPYLGGAKIAPMYVRIVHHNVRPLDNIDALPVAIDSQVRNVTEYLFTELAPSLVANHDVTIDAVRAFWEQCARLESFRTVGEAPLTGERIDRPLWLVGTYWDEWGQDVFDTCLDWAAHDSRSTGLPPEP